MTPTTPPGGRRPTSRRRVQGECRHRIRRLHQESSTQQDPRGVREMKDSPAPSLHVEVLPAEAAADGATVRHVVELVNKVYAAAEDGLWQQGATRTTRDEIVGFIRAGQIVVARLDDRIVGSIHVRRLDSDTAETGMLASD